MKFLCQNLSVFDRRPWGTQTPNVEVVVEVDTKDARDYIRRVIGY